MSGDCATSMECWLSVGRNNWCFLFGLHPMSHILNSFSVCEGQELISFAGSAILLIVFLSLGWPKCLFGFFSVRCYQKT